MQKMTQNDTQESPGKLQVLFMTPAQAAKIFSHVSKETVTEQEVRDIAEAGQLLRADDTFSLFEYCAFIVKETKNGSQSA